MSAVTPTTAPDPQRDGATGLVCALPEELGSLAGRARGRRRSAGLEILELELDGEDLLACVGGVGKVRAARAAALLLAAGATRRLLVVGVCGGLRRALRPGTLVHCTRAVQADLAVREGRELEADPTLLEAWSETAFGPAGWFVTADRPALTLWRRLRLARAFLGPCVADMETAAAAAGADAAGVPWAALRAVTDGLAPGGVRTFREHYPAQAGRAADTVEALLSRLRA
ncbi:MAG: hypothetical protein QF410_04440 [Planctomycetota bacterium]|nr:hypothetical protein [Planctomycetota bacterium]